MNQCQLCGKPLDPRLAAMNGTLAPAVRQRLLRRPAAEHAAGVCPACVAEAVADQQRERSASSLHGTTEPHTTFPYYHRQEETLLSQPQQLPDYFTLPAAGVTIAFLDSGYYPHPDLAVAAQWPGEAPPWHRLNQQQLRTVIEATPHRLVEYVDLTDHGERVGLHVDSLWDGAGDSWHGQMTTLVAAGNGLLSAGHYRGLAPAASILPVKIGRGGGRIPEEDILRGLNWLLADDRWERYGVRVVNVSIGGDFPMAWQDNPVCKAAHALVQRGVFVAAASGNRGAEELLAPAQTPTVMTVGGVDTFNRRWRPDCREEVEQLGLFHHNHGIVQWQHAPVRKPEILALGRWLAAPVLPPTPVFREMVAIGRLRSILLAEDEMALLADAGGDEDPATGWMPEPWQGVRRRMNAHKWIAPFYQHVDGTSVAVTQVSAVAAQMVQANPWLSPADIRRLMLATVAPLPSAHHHHYAGAGLLQPALAVAAALRATGGPLVGFPRSTTRLRGQEWQEWGGNGNMPVTRIAPAASAAQPPVYLGLYAPEAAAVSVTGSFNDWTPGQLPLVRGQAGWWHGAVQLPPGEHTYRFWVEGQGGSVRWLPDPENPNRVESGYNDDHSWLKVAH